MFTIQTHETNFIGVIIFIYHCHVFVQCATYCLGNVIDSVNKTLAKGTFLECKCNILIFLSYLGLKSKRDSNSVVHHTDCR